MTRLAKKGPAAAQKLKYRRFSLVLYLAFWRLKLAAAFNVSARHQLAANWRNGGCRPAGWLAAAKSCHQLNESAFSLYEKPSAAWQCVAKFFSAAKESGEAAMASASRNQKSGNILLSGSWRRKLAKAFSLFLPVALLQCQY